MIQPVTYSGNGIIKFAYLVNLKEIKRKTMIYTENYEGIKLDVQAVDFTPEKNVEERIHKMLSYLLRFTDKIVYAKIYLENKQGKATKQKSVKVQLGVPGPDVFASDSGDNFMALLASVEDKLTRQVKK